MWLSLYAGLRLIRMGKMNIVLDDELEKEFREAIFKRKGMKKGNISEALDEAIRQWIKYYHQNKKEGKHHEEQERKQE